MLQRVHPLPFTHYFKKKRKEMKKCMPLLVLLFVFLACKEHVDMSNRYVFTSHTMMSYMEKFPEKYSEYLDLLHRTRVSHVSETTVGQLLAARGNYTVFAPTNNAIHAYLESLCEKGLIKEPSWDSFRNQEERDSIEQVIVYNSIIDGGDNTIFYSNDFPVEQDGEISVPNMLDRRLTVHQSEDSVGHFLINNQPMDMRNSDIPVINGILHTMNGVVAPSNNTLGRLLFNIEREKREGYYVSAMLAHAVGLLDTLDQYRDQVYEDLYQRGIVPVWNDDYGDERNGHYFYSPEHRYYGYTYFAETDSLWESLLGKPALDITVADVTSYLEQQNIYPEAERGINYTSENNLLNQFVTYHFLPERLSTNHLIYHWSERGYNRSSKILGAAVSEFYVTMGKRRLLKIFESRESEGVYLNRFPVLNNGRRENYREKYCDPDKVGIFIGAPNLEGENNVRNGIIYPIDKLLVYDNATRTNLQKGRIRWDVSSMFPEYVNNDIRLCEIQTHERLWVYIPNEYPYLDDCDISQDTRFYYWPATNRSWDNYQADEYTIRGQQDITLRLPPVPQRGTYELRCAVQHGGGNGDERGMVQFYWGNDRDNLTPMGIPVDLRTGGLTRRTKLGEFPSDTGWEADSEDDEYNAEVDKRMRNKDWMKGAHIQCVTSNTSTYSARANPMCLRRILVRGTMDPNETYYVRFKTVLDDPYTYLYMDYFEYVAKEIYDNPEEPEDIW